MQGHPPGYAGRVTAPQQDRRRAPRALGDFPIRFSEDPDAAPAQLRDISEIGLACRSPQELPELTQISLEFQLPGASQVHRITGAVVRCDPLDDGTFDVAVFFTDIQTETRVSLSNFVRKSKPA